MALTARQILWAQSPYRQRREDLATLMQILLDRSEWEVFGTAAPEILRQIAHAAMSHNMLIPEAFQRILRELNDPSNQGYHIDRSAGFDI